MAASKGLTVIETVLVVATVAVIAFVGFAIYQASQDMVEIEDPVAENNGPEADREDMSGDSTIDDERDLEEARDSLDNIDFQEELDSSELSLEEES